MKKNLVLFFLLIGTGLFAQGDVAFKTTTHSFGKVKQHVPATFIFTFTNTSSKPVIIEFATAECGCTTPEYSKEAILKGKSSEIKVTYNSENLGTFKKNVNVKFVNVVQPIVLTIDGEVEAAKADK